jgi:hypothetical protein
MTSQSASQPSNPWWHYGHVWLILGLLAFAVSASFGLLYAAIKIGETDTVYSDPLHPQDGSPPKITQPNMLPAEEARNHAATGGIGAPHLAKPAPALKHGEGSPYAPADD